MYTQTIFHDYTRSCTCKVAIKKMDFYHFTVQRTTQMHASHHIPVATTHQSRALDRALSARHVSLRTQHAPLSNSRHHRTFNRRRS
eukprot:SAG11_NODE_11594_length_750_cov_1.490015_1_plen_85_part_10